MRPQRQKELGQKELDLNKEGSLEGRLEGLRCMSCVWTRCLFKAAPGQKVSVAGHISGSGRHSTARRQATIIDVVAGRMLVCRYSDIPPKGAFILDRSQRKGYRESFNKRDCISGHVAFKPVLQAEKGGKEGREGKEVAG